MRGLRLLPLAVAAAAFVIPDEQTLNSLTLNTEDKPSPPFFDRAGSFGKAWDDLDGSLREAWDIVESKFETSVDSTLEIAVRYGEKFQDAFAGESWLRSADGEFETDGTLDGPGHWRPPHRKPKRPPHHHHKPNMTVYELIAKSKYTTKLAAAISEYGDLVDLLNGTTANFTVFAPTDKAFGKIPKHAPVPSKEVLKKILTYHVSSEFYPAGRVLVTRTIPTAFKAEAIGDAAQRLSTQIGFRGLTVNFFSRVVEANIFGTNGVIHGVDSLLLPPPKAVDVISSLPGQFSTFELALFKTGLYSKFNDSSRHVGGTLFLPSNFAFEKLGPRINGFLFSPHGVKYLKALVLYHAVENFTLYSDAYYNFGVKEQGRIPKAIFHVDLPTALGKSLSVDVRRFGRFITMKINGFTNVAVLDGIVADGVIHVVPNILIPPKTPVVSSSFEEDMSIDEFKDRLEPFVEKGILDMEK